jgi:hypothetical protein
LKEPDDNLGVYNGGLVMKLSNLKRSLGCVVAVIAIAGCAGGGSNSSPNNNSSSTGSSGGALSSIDQQVYASSGPYANFQVVTINTTNLTITISVPLPVPPVSSPQVGVAVPQIPGGTITIEPNSSGLWTASLTMPLADLAPGIIYSKPATLPNGEDLPGLGAMGMLEVNVVLDSKTNLNFYLYGSTTAIAIFWPTPGFDDKITLVVPITNKAGTKDLGFVGIIGEVGTYSSGLYGAYLFPPELQQCISVTPPKFD